MVVPNRGLSGRGPIDPPDPLDPPPVRIADPFWLALLIFAGLPWLAHRRRPRVAWPTLASFDRAGRSPRAWIRSWSSPTLRAAAIACMVVGLARPQTAGEQVRISGRGVAIALVVDRSSSMKTADFPLGAENISRLDAARETIGQFLEARLDDLIGVVAFANLPDTVAPPTLDRRFAWQAIRGVRPAGAADDGTDVGGAIAWGLGMLRPVPTQRKVLILLTDGRHAPGASASLDPMVAAEVARGLGVTLHTVAVGRPPAPPGPGEIGSASGSPAPGTPGGAARPGGAAGAAEASPPAGSATDGPDFELLRRLAERGGGRAFRAGDSEALADAFEEIDSLETSPVQGTIQTVYRERFAPWVAAALGLAALDLALGSGRGRRIS